MVNGVIPVISENHVTLVTGVFYLSSWIQWRLVIKQLNWAEFNVSKKGINLFLLVYTVGIIAVNFG